MAFFSIIIPAYNVERYLSDCITSILSQSNTDWEVIIVDDGSTDHTREIAELTKSTDSRFSVYSQSHQGAAASRNLAILYAKGEYIVFLDADDVFTNCSFLTDVQTEIQKHKSPDIIALNVERLSDDNSLIKTNDTIYSHDQHLVFSSGKAYLTYFVKTKHWGPTGMFYIMKKNLIEQHHIRFHEGIVHEDCLFMPIACFYARSVVVCPNLRYCYRMRKNSVMHSNEKKRINDAQIVAKKLYTFFLQQNYVNPISNSIVFNNAILGKDYWLAWETASFKRKIKIILGFYQLH